MRIYQGRPDALALLEPALPPGLHNSSLEITRSSLLGIAYRRTGDLSRAEHALSQGEKLCPDEPSCADVRLAQGIVDLEKGKLDDAQHAFTLSLASARANGDTFEQTRALINLGVVGERQEQYEEALSRFSEASSTAKTIGARLLLEKATGGIGWAYYKLGNYRRALENSRLAERQAAALGASIDRVEWLNNAGLSQFRLGDLAAARSSYQQSYQLARALQNDEEIGDSLVALAYLSLETGALPQALREAREAQRLALQKGNADDALQPSLIEALALARQGQTDPAKAKLLALEQNSAAEQSDRWEIENALATLSAASGDGPQADLWFRRAIETFRTQRSSLSDIDARLPFFENGSTLYLGYMEHLIEERKTTDALNVLDQSRAETLAEGLVSEPSQPRQITARPASLARRLDATILVYCLRPHTSYLWAITPQRSAFFRLPGREAIVPLVEAHTRAILASKDILAEQNPAGLILYRLLVEPAAALLAPGRKVFVIAGEGLNGLNFETLISDTRTPHYWIEDANVIDARSLSLLSATRDPRNSGSASKRLLLVGDPLYNSREFLQLPRASQEVASVAAHFPADRRRILTGPAATPSAYRSVHPGSFAYIHFVAHGTANEIDPLDSSVILSGNSGESYKLYARDILAQRLDADLVTISACYGSGVRSYSGEGLIGLAWAFLHAGAHKVVGALWDVSDVSTPQLMNDFYSGLARGRSPDIALRSAKLAMIHGTGIFRKPLYWAPFQLYSGA